MDHCIIKPEREKCMEKITLHNLSENLELGRKRCVAEGFSVNAKRNSKVVSKSGANTCSVFLFHDVLKIHFYPTMKGG